MKTTFTLTLSFFVAINSFTQANLTINFSGVDSFTPSAELTFPDGTKQIITEDKQIAITQKGNYQISGGLKFKTNPVADEIYSFQTKKINVQKLEGEFTLTAEYTKHLSSGMLFIPNRQNEILGFYWEDIMAGNTEPKVKIVTETEVLHVVTDSLGNLWFWDNEKISKINHYDVVSGNAKISLSAPVSLAYNSLFNSNAIHVDNQNRLWMSLMHENQLIVIDLDKIVAEKNVQPIAILQTKMAITDFAFSNDYSKIAVSGIGGFVVYEMPSTVTGKIELNALSKSDEEGTFTAVDFDKENNLWVSSENGGIFKFTPSIYSKPTLKISMAEVEIKTPEFIYWGILFDNSNNLWAMPRWSDGEFGIDFFEAANLNENASPTRHVFTRYAEHGKFEWCGRK